MTDIKPEWIGDFNSIPMHVRQKDNLELIASLPQAVCGKDVAKARLQLIVKAVNNHAKLVEALGRCKYVLGEQLVGDEGATMEEAIEAWEAAKAALAAVKEE